LEELRRYSLDTGYYLVVDTPHQFINQIAWSPDGRYLAMAADIPGEGRRRLFVLDLESGESSPLDRRRGGPQALTWSGRYLIYTYFVWTPDDRLYLMRWDSRSERRRQVDRPGMDSVLTRFGSISAARCG
jgi:Tol biopolymer transport system component